MASILDILNTRPGEQLITRITDKSGIKKEKAVTALGMILPVIVGAIKDFTEERQDETKLEEFLEWDTYNGELLTNLQKAEASEISNQGKEVLNQFFGTQQQPVQVALSKMLNISEENIMTIFEYAAAVVMNILGKQMQIEKLKTSALASLVSAALGSSAAYEDSFVQSLIIEDEDGRVIDDVTGMVIGGGNNKKKDDSILKGFTGGK